MPNLRNREPFAALLFIAATASACSAHNVRLVSPDTTPGARYTCQPGAAAACQPAATDVPEDLNPSGTVFLILPRECQGKFNQIVVIDAGSAKPKVDATCAPAEEPLQEMSSNAPPPARSASSKK